MGLINTTNITNDPVLDKIVHGYEPKDMDFVGHMVLPKMKVNSDKGDIPEAGTEFLRIHNNVTVGKGKTPEINITFSKASGWVTEEHRLQIGVSKKDGLQWNRQNWKNGQTKAKNTYGKMLKKTMMIAKEKAIADAIQSTSIMTNNTTLSGADQWNNSTTSDPISDVKTAKDSVYDNTGNEANLIVMNRKVFETLIHHPKVKETIGISGLGTVPIMVLTLAQLALAFNIQNVAVGRAFYETAAKGQTSSKSSIWGNSATVCYVNPNPSPEIFEDSLGYSFELTSLMADSYIPQDPPNTVYVREQWEYDDAILKVGAGYLIKNAVA